MVASLQPDRARLARIALIAVAFALAAALGAAAGFGTPIGIVAVAGLAVLCGAFVSWQFGIAALLVASGIDGFVKHATLTPLAYILKDALCAALVAGLIVRAGTHPLERPRLLRLALVCWGLYVAYLATQLLHPYASFSGGLAAFRAHALFALLVPAGAFVIDRPRRVVAVAAVFAAVVAVCGISALVQHLMGPKWLALGPGFAKASLHYSTFTTARDQLVPGAVTSSYRAYGTLVDPAAMGLACAYGALAAIAGLGRARGWARLGYPTAIAAAALGLFLSQTRSAIAALAVGLLALGLLSVRDRRTRPVVFTGAIVVVLALPAGIALTHGTLIERLVASKNVAYAAQTRERSRTIVLDELAANPLGHGLGATGAGGMLRDDTGLSIDNVYVAVLYETGIPGLATFVAVQLALLAATVRAALRARNLGVRTVFAGAAAGQIGLLVSASLTQGAFDYAPIAQAFWLFSGAALNRDLVEAA